jgi:hypothetical protein
MKKLFAVIVLFLMVSFNSFAQEKEKKVVKLEAVKVAKTRGGNTNIKTDLNLNAKDVAVPKPADDRGDFCSITFDNWTGYSVKVYVDGDYKLWLSPWSEGSVTVFAGYTTAYCITSGGTYEWSANGDCDSHFYFKLEE